MFVLADSGWPIGLRDIVKRSEESLLGSLHVAITLLELHVGSALLNHVLVAESLDFLCSAIVLIENVWRCSAACNLHTCHEPPGDGRCHDDCEEGSEADVLGSGGVHGGDAAVDHGHGDPVVVELRVWVSLLVMSHYIDD